MAKGKKTFEDLAWDLRGIGANVQIVDEQGVLKTIKTSDLVQITGKQGHGVKIKGDSEGKFPNLYCHHYNGVQVVRSDESLNFVQATI